MYQLHLFYLFQPQFCYYRKVIMLIYYYITTCGLELF